MNKPHKKLRAWQLGMEITVDIYRITKKFPSEEKFGLTSQMRRSAVSIPSNISEGAARNSEKEFLKFLYIALGSLSELDTQVEIARQLKFIDQATVEILDKKLIEEDKVLSGLIRSKKAKLS